jgi:hypothetical protein
MREPSLEEMWKTIEGFGIERVLFEKTNPTHEDILNLYRLIRKRKHDKRDLEMIKRLREHCEKLKKRNKS